MGKVALIGMVGIKTVVIKMSENFTKFNVGERKLFVRERAI